MNYIDRNQPQAGAIESGVDSNSIIQKGGVSSLAAIFDRSKQAGGSSSSPVAAKADNSQVEQKKFNTEMRDVSGTQVEFVEPRLALGQNFRVQVVKEGQLVFDEGAGKELRDEAVADLKEARHSPDQFEARVGTYSKKSVVARGKDDAKQRIREARLDRTDRAYSKKETEMVESGITHRFVGDFSEVIGRGQIRPSHIPAEILADLKVDDKIPAKIETDHELHALLDHEIDSYPSHMLSDIPQPDLKGVSQRQAVKDLTHKLVALYKEAYPEKSNQDAYLLARDAARVITYQTHYDLGHWSGSSHSIKHILHNIELAESMMKGISNDHLSNKDRFLINLVHMYHDIGYTVPMAQHTTEWPSASSDHPLTGGKFLEANEEYFTSLIGEAGFHTLRDSVFLHSHFNSDFDTSTFRRQVSSHKVLEDETIHPGIVRSVTSGSDCCAVSSDIKLQEFWMNPSVIMNTGRLQYAFQSMLKQYVARTVAEKLSALTPQKLEELSLTELKDMSEDEINSLSKDEKLALTKEKYKARVIAEAKREAKGHIKFDVLCHPEFIRPDDLKLSNFDSAEEMVAYLQTPEFDEQLREKIDSSAEELADKYKTLTPGEYKELLTTYASVKKQLVIDAWGISRNAAEAAGLEDENETLTLAESRFKSLVKAIDRNFNIMSVQKAFGQYGAKFQGIKVKEGDEVSFYTMVSKWVPSKAVGHLRNTNNAAFAAWQKLGDELGINEDEIELFLNAYMTYREAKDNGDDEAAADLKQKFINLKVQLCSDNADKGVAFESTHGKLIIKGPKGKMVIKTKKPGEDEDVVEAFTKVLQAVSDEAIRDELLAIKAFGDSIKGMKGVNADFIVKELVDDRLNTLLSQFAKLPMEKQEEMVDLMGFVNLIYDELNEAVKSGNYEEKLIEVAERIGSFSFGTDQYINEGIVA